MPVRIIVTEGSRHDSKEAKALIDGITAEALLADKAYDMDELIEEANLQGTRVVIPPKKNRKQEREFDKALYKLRHLVENAFLHLKRWRGIATRYAKNTASFLSAVQIRAIFLWLKVI